MQRTQLQQLLDSPLNKISPSQRVEILQDASYKILLGDITHIIDCECYRLSPSIIYYREVSVFSLKIFSFISMQCYDERYPVQEKLCKKDRQTVHYQYGIHGLNFLNEKTNSVVYSQEEMYTYLKSFCNANVLFAYKGGDVESTLCKKLNIPSVNLEHFEMEKYIKLLDIYNLRSRMCKHHYIAGVHCSLFEVFLFAARVFDKLEKNNERDKAVELYIRLNIYKL